MEASLVIILSLLAGIVQCQKIISPPESTAHGGGDSATFACEVELGFTLFMSWKHNNDVVYFYQNGTESYPKGKDKYEIIQDGKLFTLTIKQLKYSDGGSIQCTVTGQSAEAKLIILDSGEKSSILTPPEDATGIASDEARFRCEIIIEANTLMEWGHYNNIIYSYQYGAEHYIEDQEEKYSVAIQGGTFILTVKNLTYADGGTYTCGVIEDEKSANLVVLGKPRLISSAEEPLEGFNVVYTCHAAFGGPPKRDTLVRHYPKLRISFDGIPWDDEVYEESPGGITHYFHLRQDHYVTLSADMDGKKLRCELTTSYPERTLSTTEEITVLLSEEKSKPDGQKHVDISTMLLVIILLLCIGIILITVIAWWSKIKSNSVYKAVSNGGSNTHAITKDNNTRKDLTTLVQTA